MLAGAAFALPSQAQLLKVTVKDTTIFENAKLSCQGNFTPVKLDKRKTWVFQSDSIQKLTRGSFLGSNIGIIPLYMEPGKTTRMTISREKDIVRTKYSGDNAAANRFLEKYINLTHGKYEFDPREFAGMDKERVRMIEERMKREAITFEQAHERLESRYAATLKAASREKDAMRRAWFEKLTKMKYTAEGIELAEKEAEANHQNVKEDAHYQRLLSQIDPNDEDGLDMVLRLPQAFMQGKVSRRVREGNLNAYASEYMDVLNRHITNPRIRATLLESLASSVISYAKPDREFDIDAFWNAFKQNASPKLSAQLQRVIDSKKATMPGAKCPDISFSDPQGKSHHLSEYFGKVLYIDIWATWCAPCCAEIPYIENHVAHYKDQPGIQFISISIDTNQQAWRAKLEKDQPQWLQFVCSSDEYKQLSRQWGVTSIPRFIIVNADGTIRSNNAFRPSEPDFVRKMDNILGTK